MKLSRLAVVLLIVLGYGSGVLPVSAAPDFVTAIQEKGRTFIMEKTAFSTEKPKSEKNAVLQSTHTYPETSVCVVDGSYLYSEVDLDATAFSIEVQRVYRSLPDREGLFGSGWKLGYQMRLYPMDFDGAPAVAVERADGRIVIFQRGRSGFVSPLGNRLRLAESNDGTYVLTEFGVRRFFFDRHGRLAKVERKRFKPIDVSYDGATDRLTEIRNDAQILIRFIYNADGQIEASEDFTGRRYTYRYDNAKRLTEVIDPFEQHLQYQYDANGYLQAIIDRRGNLQTEIIYTPTGQVESYTRNGEKYHIQYLNETQTLITDSQSNQWTYHFLLSGLFIETRDPYGNTTSGEYDRLSRLIQETDKRGSTFKYLYDDANRTKRVINPLGSVTTSLYKEREWVVKVPPGKIITHRFNENGDLVEVTIGTQEKVLSRDRYIYDASGNLVQHIDPRGNTTQFMYNAEGYLIQKIDGAGNTTRWRYDPLGRIVWEQDPTDRITETSYDILGRVVEISRTDGAGVAE